MRRVYVVKGTCILANCRLDLHLADGILYKNKEC